MAESEPHSPVLGTGKFSMWMGEFSAPKKLNEALHYVKNGIFQLIAALPHILPRAFQKFSITSAPLG